MDFQEIGQTRLMPMHSYLWSSIHIRMEIMPQVLSQSCLEALQRYPIPAITGAHTKLLLKLTSQMERLTLGELARSLHIPQVWLALTPMLEPTPSRWKTHTAMVECQYL